MEDISRVHKTPASADDDNAKKVVELTPEMEIGTEKGGKIYDLTQAEDGTVYSAPDIGPSRESQTKENDPQPPVQSEKTIPPVSEIEKEIDAAFDNIEPYSPIDLSDGLDERPAIPDELDDLKQLADDVLSETSSTPDTTGAEGDEQTTETGMEVSPPEAAHGTAHETVALQHNGAESEDEEILDLVEIVPLQSSEEILPNEMSPSPENDDEEDEIIDLVDIVSMKPQTTARVDVASELIEEGPEDLIELTDIVKQTTDPALNGIGVPQLADSDPDLENLEVDQPAALEPEEAPDDDHVIQLSDILQNSRNRDSIAASSDLDDSGKDEDEKDEMRDLSAGIGMVLEDQTGTLSDDTIEAAIERYIRARYGGDLERMIAAVVEKAVAREIEQLKRSFMDENEAPE